MSDDEGSDYGEPRYQVLYEGEEQAKPDKYLRKDGKAAAKFENGDTYVGHYLNGKRHGLGVYTFVNGAKYDGEYVSGKKEGQGRMLYPDGSHYVGAWKADRKEGRGTHTYANGDVYEGEWKADRKHGKGTYSYANNGSRVSGDWSNGRLMHGEWSRADGSRFVGSWAKNQPNGLGLHVFPNGNQEVGTYSIDRKLGYKWNSNNTSVPRVSPSPGSPAGTSPTVATPDPLKVAQRFLDKALFKLDHFEGIYRLKKEVEGVPNLRKVVGENTPIFACGQPTRSGFTNLFTWGSEQHETDKFIWINLRAEPIVYVKENSFVPRSKHTLHTPMSVGAQPLNAAQLSVVETKLAEKLRTDIAHRGNLHLYLKDTFADHPSDRKHLDLSEEVEVVVDEETGEEGFGDAITTLAQLYERFAEEDGVDVEYHRLPLPSSRFPDAQTIDSLVALLKSQDPSTGLVFNDQMGRGRSTLASTLALIMRRTAEAVQAAASEEQDNAGEDGEELDADGNPIGGGEGGAAGANGGSDLSNYDESDPNFKMGQYQLIMRLVNRLPQGEQLKAQVDEAIDRCKSMQSLREVILYSKEMSEKEAASGEAGVEERQSFWLSQAQDFVERYAYLLLFQAYVKANVESEFEQQTFAQYVEANKDLIRECIGSKQEGPLAEFRWQ